jgi:hypothetical protein
MDTKAYWMTDDPSVFEIGKRRVRIKKIGRAQAEQIVDLNRWLKEHIAPLAEAIKSASGEMTNAVGLEVLTSMMGQLTVEAQIDLAKVVLGNKDEKGADLGDEFFNEFYDIDWVLSGLETAGRSASAQRLITAFFTSAV